MELNGNINNHGDNRRQLSNHQQSTAIIDDSELAFKLRETEQLLEISLLKKKLLETEKAMSKIIADMGHKTQVSFFICLINIEKTEKY